MFIKVFCILAIAIVVSAGYGHTTLYFKKHNGHHHLVHVHDDHFHGHHHHHVDYYRHPKYKFKYPIKELHPGDHKEYHEHRDGGNSKEHYSYKEPDGPIRHVYYHSDKKTGFHADVKHRHHLHHYDHYH